VSAIINYIENLEKKVERLEKELKEAKGEISAFKSDDFSVLYKNTINDVYNNFKRNNDIYQVDTTSENEGGFKFSLVQWSPKGTKIEDFKMLILDIRLLQTKDDIRVKVSIRVKVPDENPTLLRNHRDTSKFEVTYSRKDFIKLSSGEPGEIVNNLVTKLIINNPLADKYSPDINLLTRFLNVVFMVYSTSDIERKPYLEEESDYLKAIYFLIASAQQVIHTKGNLKACGVLIYSQDRREIGISNEKYSLADVYGFRLR
jgi:hypothetical protein